MIISKNRHINTLKQIIPIWFFYILFINIYVFVLIRLGFIPLENQTSKEIFFALWGYGWDGGHFIRISRLGYIFPLQAFFPLYPLLIKFLNVFFPLTLAFRINVILLLPTVFLLYKFMGYLKLSVQDRLKILILFLAFPTAFFLQANYVETLYILLSCVGLMFLLDKKFLLASIFAGLLSAVKVSGISLGLVIVLSFIMEETNFLKSKPSGLLKFFFKAIMYLVIASLGIFLYFLYLQRSFGSFSIFFTSHAEWGRRFIPENGTWLGFLGGYLIPIYRSIMSLDVSVYRRLSEFTAFIFVSFFLFKSFKKIPLEVWVFSFMQVIIPISSGSFLSFNRLSLLSYPVILFGLDNMTEKKVTFWLCLVLFSTLQMLGIYLFFNNVFVG